MICLSVSNANEPLEKLQHCLKLNPTKTEFLRIETKLQQEKILNDFPCLILGQDTNLSASAKNLGLVFDSSLHFREHVSQTCRACFYNIHALCRIKKSMFLARQIAVVGSVSLQKCQCVLELDTSVKFCTQKVYDYSKYHVIRPPKFFRPQ